MISRQIFLGFAIRCAYEPVSFFCEVIDDRIRLRIRRDRGDGKYDEASRVLSGHEGLGFAPMDFGVIIAEELLTELPKMIYNHEHVDQERHRNTR